MGFRREVRAQVILTVGHLNRARPKWAGVGRTGPNWADPLGRLRAMASTGSRVNGRRGQLEEPLLYGVSAYRRLHLREKGWPIFVLRSVELRCVLMFFLDFISSYAGCVRSVFMMTMGGQRFSLGDMFFLWS